MLGRVVARFGLVAAIAVAVAGAPHLAQAASPGPQIALTKVSMIARGAALKLTLATLCTDDPSNNPAVLIAVTQTTTGGVQHASALVPSITCDGQKRSIQAVIYPPAALDPPESPQAVYGTAWTLNPALVQLQLGTSGGVARVTTVAAVVPGAPAAPAIAPVAVSQAGGAGVVTTLHLACTAVPSSDPEVHDAVIVTLTQVGGHASIQTSMTSVPAHCDGTTHAYRVAFAAKVRPWLNKTALVQAQECLAYMTYCKSPPTNALRTVQVHP